MNTEHMDERQYTELTKSINRLATDVNKLHGKFGDIDKKVTSITNWISGDPLIDSSYGTEHKLQKLTTRVENNTRELERVKRIDDMEKKVHDHDDKLNKIWTVVTVVGIMASVIGAVAGIFIPPMIP